MPESLKALSYGTELTMRHFLALTAILGLVSCGTEAPVSPDEAGGQPTLARGGARGGGGQTQYSMTFLGGLESDPTHPFTTAAKTGDPFAGSVSGNPVYLLLPAASGGSTAVCDADGSGLGATSASWGAYGGIWKGSFSVSVKGGKYHLSYVADREVGGGYLNLVVNGPAVKSNGDLTLTFTNARGLVAANSTPDGGPTDPQDRCLTFSITATP